MLSDLRRAALASGAEVLALDLESLGDLHPIRGPFSAKFLNYRDAAKVRLESHGHVPGCLAKLAGSIKGSARLQWLPAHEALPEAYRDDKATTRDAAIGVAAVAIEELTGTFFQREGNAEGDGFDFSLWYGDREEVEHLSAVDRLALRYRQRVALLKVAGVSSASSSAENKMREKIRKFRSIKMTLPLWICVVDFREPAILLEGF